MKSDDQKKSELKEYLTEVLMEKIKIHGRKYSDSEFAQWADVPGANMSRYLTAKMVPRPGNILSMARVMPRVMDICEYPEDLVLRRLLFAYFTSTLENREEVIDNVEKIFSP